MTMMRFLLAFLLLVPLARGSETDRAERLEALKRQFPKHVSGPVTEKTPPEIKLLWNRYRAEVEAITLANLSERLVHLERSYQSDLDLARRTQKDGILGQAGRTAAKQNERWLTLRLAPFVERMALFEKQR